MENRSQVAMFLLMFCRSLRPPQKPSTVALAPCDNGI